MSKFQKVLLGCLIALIVFAVYPEAEKLIAVDNIPVTVETPVTEPPEVPETVETIEFTEPVPTETAKPTEALDIPETVPETTEVVETKFVSYYSYTEEELDLLARLIDSEGGGESYATKLKIGSAVMNRVEDPDFPDTIHGVIYQKTPAVQFSVTVVKIDGVVMIDRPASEESYRAAKEVLDYGSVLPSGVQVFYATYCKEPWVTSRAVYGTFDNTVFAYTHRG